MTSESPSDQGDVAEDRSPPWWMAWEIFAPRWAMAAEGLYDLRADAFDKFQCAGFDTSRLREWVPTSKQGRRIILASQLVKLALNEPLADLPTRKCHLAEQLAGDGVWADLRRLAEAYLDGKHRLAEGRKLTLSPAASPLAKPLFPSQIRKLENRQLLADLINRVSLLKAQTPLELFFEHATELTLYLDEAWFVGQHSAVNPNEGVIAGLICHGTPGELIRGLPRLHNHSYLTPLQLPEALERLWQCPGCLPLIFHLRLPTHTVASPYYDLLLQQTIRFLLGWLLPRPRQSVRLHICPEAIAPTHPEGDTATDFYQGLLAGDACGRFANWDLAQVRWRNKQFGYIPYADLLAHLTLEHTDVNRALGAWVNFKELPGYVPFSLELVPRLERLEHLETSANLTDVIDFALETGASRFGQLVLNDIRGRLATRLDLQQHLLETLEERYRDKVRDLGWLGQALGAVRRLLKTLPANASTRMRLLWYLLALQDANHDGDPVRIRATAETYLRERETLKQNERELCVDADLNLAVHYADRFAFGHAEVTVSEWIEDPLFLALSPRQRGRLYSALGQYRAMQDDAQVADGLFLKALELFAQDSLSEGERAGELEQTRIYRAINALDGDLRGAAQALAAVFGPITAGTAKAWAGDGSLANQYRHHLLLRALCLRPDLEGARLAYLAGRDHWQVGHPQHPWPSIHGYRGFLLWNQETLDEDLVAASLAAFDRAIALAWLDRHGPTISLIGALWATVAACCFENVDYVTPARALLGRSSSLPDAAPAIATLNKVLAAPEPSRIGEALGALPFNYR